MTRTLSALSAPLMLVLGAGCPQDIVALAPDAAEAVDVQVEDRDSGASDEGVSPDALLIDAGPPPMECEVVPPPCLDASRPDVLVVTDRASQASALAAAQPGQTIMFRGVRIDTPVEVPPSVSVFGCEDSRVASELRLTGGTSRIEGFEVTGTLLTRGSGQFTIRLNRLGGQGMSPSLAVRLGAAATSTPADILIERNRFGRRDRAIEITSTFDETPAEVRIQVRNNIFRGIRRPVFVAEAGPEQGVGLALAYNTFFNFDEAVRLDRVGPTVESFANVLVKGSRAFMGIGPYTTTEDFVWELTSPGGLPPVRGAFTTMDPRFVDAVANDFRPGPDSPLIDRITEAQRIPDRDHFGCPRPIGRGADVGAVERQP